MLRTRLLAASALAAGTFFIPSLAWAQTTPEAVAGTATNTDTGQPDKGTANEADDDQAIVVTGSRIRSPNLESSIPVSVVTGAEFFQTGKLSVGDILNELPQLRSTFTQGNSTRFLGTRGLSLVDLRGLGPNRTLVLVNGRRHVAGDILNTGTSVDVNTIPIDLIDRVDVATNAGSSVYGSDAIAGVVNFILKDNYDGIQVRGQGGVSQYGDAGNQYVSALVGRNFAEDRGNIAVNLEFSHQGRFYASGRPNLRDANSFVVVDSDPAGSVNGSDGVPDRTFFRDIRSATISTGGLINLRQGAAAPCGSGGGSPFSCTFLFQPDGTLIPQTGTRVGLGPNGSFIGGNGYRGREGQLLTLIPDLKRYSANLIGHFAVSDAFVPFVEAKYVRTDAFGSQSGPFFSQGTTLGDGIAVSNANGISGITGTVNRERVRLDNPFLSTQARNLLTQQILAAGVDPNSTAATAPALTAAQRAQIAAGTFRVNLRKNLVDLGIRDERLRRETYRIVGGVRGDFNDDWNYEVSVNYGEFKERNIIQGNINTQRYLLAVDSVRNPATGQIVCRSQLDPQYAGTDVAGDAANLARDVAACVPLNPFGDGSISQAARDYLTVASRASGKITQFVASGFVTGDLSQLFELPGGPIGFSIGAEYRRETNKYQLDAFTQAGYAFYNAIPSLVAPSFQVKEVYGELQLPIVKDVPFLQELTVKGSGRIADYKGSVGTVYAYSGQADWRPIKDVRFRGAYSRSVRAPNLTELYAAQGQNFAPAPNDPCSARNLAAGSSNRAANCTAAGRPANYDFVYGQSLETVSGGNPLLRQEKSDTYTGGVVFTPSFLPGFSISADYFDITVKNVISSVSAQQILNLCYDSASISNGFCGLFQRAGATGGPAGEIPFQVLEGSLIESTANFAKLKARGVDTTVNYRHQFDWGSVNLGAVWTRTIQRDDFLNPDDPTFKNRLLGELGDPKNRVNFNSSFKRGSVTVGYQLRWIDKMFINTYEDLNALNGLPPQNADYAERKYYPDVFYHDVRLDFEVNDQFDLYGGVDNIGNRNPPLGLTGIGGGIDSAGGPGIYDNRGRFFYVGAIAKF